MFSRDRFAPVARDGVRVFVSRVVVVQVHDFAIPNDLMRVAVALIQVGIGQDFARLSANTVNAETIEHVSLQARVSRSRIAQATGQVVIMVLARAFGMALTGILKFVRHGVFSIAIERTEKRCAGQRDPDWPQVHAGWACGHHRICRQAVADALRFDRVWVAVVLVGIIVGGNGVRARRVFGQAVTSHSVPGILERDGLAARPGNVAVHNGFRGKIKSAIRFDPRAVLERTTSRWEAGLARKNVTHFGARGDLAIPDGQPCLIGRVADRTARGCAGVSDDAQAGQDEGDNQTFNRLHGEPPMAFTLPLNGKNLARRKGERNNWDFGQRCDQRNAIRKPETFRVFTITLRRSNPTCQSIRLALKSLNGHARRHQS